MNPRILQYPNSALREICKDVEDFAEVPDIVAKMKAAISQPFVAKALGLAANQIGILKRVILVEQGGQWITMVNPEIVERAGAQTVRDGCLSFDFGRTFKTRVRPSFIKVEYQNERGEPCRRKAKGMHAAAIAHECDHLEGRMFFDEIDERAA